MKAQSSLAQSGLLSSDGGRSRRSASINPDSLIPSRMAILVSQYARPQNNPKISDSTSSTRQSIPAISIGGSPVVGAEPTASDCTPPAENSNPSGASEGADGQGACILTLDQAGRALRKVWLPAYVESQRASEFALKAYRRHGKSSEIYWNLHWLAHSDVLRVVEAIKERGGLLLIGGVQ